MGSKNLIKLEADSSKKENVKVLGETVQIDCIWSSKLIAEHSPS